MRMRGRGTEGEWRGERGGALTGPPFHSASHWFPFNAIHQGQGFRASEIQVMAATLAGMSTAFLRLRAEFDLLKDSVCDPVDQPPRPLVFACELRMLTTKPAANVALVSERRQGRKCSTSVGVQVQCCRLKNVGQGKQQFISLTVRHIQ